MAASRTQADWFLYQAGNLSFRAFAEGKTTWILNGTAIRALGRANAMKNLAMSITMAGANFFWDAQGHEMARSNDPATRKQIFGWIEKNEKTLYLPRTPMRPVGVYFSPKSRDYAAKSFLPSYRGALVSLLQAHRELQVVTPRTLAKFRGPVLVLPNVSVLDDTEKMYVKSFVEHGGHLVILGVDTTGLPVSPNISVLSSDPAAAFYTGLLRDFAAASANPPVEFLKAADAKADIELSAPATAWLRTSESWMVRRIFLLRILADWCPTRLPWRNQRGELW